jgi:hypothetical protein
LEAEHARGEHAGESGEIDPQAEVEAAQQAHVDAQDGDRIEVEGSGANAHAEARPPRIRNNPTTATTTSSTMNIRGSGHEEELAAERRIEPGWDRIGRLCGPQMKRVPSLQDIGQAEG